MFVGRVAKALWRLNVSRPSGEVSIRSLALATRPPRTGRCPTIEYGRLLGHQVRAAARPPRTDSCPATETGRRPTTEYGGFDHCERGGGAVRIVTVRERTPPHL